MSFDPVQMLRQTYAHGADQLKMMELAAGKGAEAAGAQAAQTGTVNGTAFQVETDPMAELMDSMEELSFQFEEKAQKKISERKMGEMQGPRTSYLKALEAWMSTLPDMPDQEFMAKLMRQVREAMTQGRAMDAQDLLKELARGSTDPSHQFAMLDIMEQGCSDAEGDMKALIREAKSRLERAKGPEIRAGINLAEEINGRASTPGEMQNLRDLYRGEVVGFTSPQECFRSLLARGGAEGLANSIEFLIASCGVDMKSAHPSLSSEELGRILTDLQCVDVLQTVLDDLTALAARMGTQFGEKCLLDGMQLSGRVMDLTEQPFVGPGAMAALISDCGLVKLLAKMDFSREMIKLFRRLSPRLFARESDRKQLVDSAQEHLDGLVMRELEEEEEEGAA